MSGLRTHKSKLRRVIYDTRDTIIGGIEDRNMEGKEAMALCQRTNDLFKDFHYTCADQHREWDIYKEIDKQARLKAEYDRVRTDVEEASAMVHEYFEYLENARFRHQAQALREKKKEQEVTQLAEPERAAIN